MRIVVNGQPMEVGEGLTVEQLLAQLGVRREYTAVAVNREIAPRAGYATIVLREGDRVEIVHPMAGGAAGAPEGRGWRTDGPGARGAEGEDGHVG